MKEETTLLHLMMQLHLPDNRFIPFKELLELTKWSAAQLSRVLKCPWFDPVWDRETQSIAFVPSSEGFDHVAKLFYAEHDSPFSLDRDALTSDVRGLSEVRLPVPFDGIVAHPPCETRVEQTIRRRRDAAAATG